MWARRKHQHEAAHTGTSWRATLQPLPSYSQVMPPIQREHKATTKPILFFVDGTGAALGRLQLSKRTGMPMQGRHYPSSLCFQHPSHCSLPSELPDDEEIWGTPQLLPQLQLALARKGSGRIFSESLMRNLCAKRSVHSTQCGSVCVCVSRMC